MLVIGGISLASSVADKPLDKFANKHGNNGIMKKGETIGNNLPFAALGYSGLMLMTSDEDSRLAKASYSSLAAGGLGVMSALGLKYTVGRARPNLDLGPASFTPVSKSNSNTSWPSIHTTVMWAAITPYAKAYDQPWLYGVAAATNVARVAGRNHWFSDTVAGSMLGYAIGDFVWESHKTNKHAANFAVSPNGVTAYWKIE
jgi:membrane-associated phospholipid phosphatase